MVMRMLTSNMRLARPGLLILILALSLISLSGQPAVAAQRQKAAYVVEFISRDPANDWARIARQLVDRGLADIKTERIISQSRGPCDTVLEVLGFLKTDVKLRCSIGIQELIADLAHGKYPGGHPVPPGMVAFPDLPIQSSGLTQNYDRRFADERLRCEDVQAKWAPFATSNCDTGRKDPLGFVELHTYEMFVVVPYTRENDHFIRSLERFNEDLRRNDIEVFRVHEPAKYSLPNGNNPVSWIKNCTVDGPTGPRPAYATLLGLSSMPECKCGQNCPKIILFDQAPAAHPDIVAKVKGQSDLEPSTVPACNLVGFKREEHHGTHLAGILVSRASPDSFDGLAPWAKLIHTDSRTGLPFLKLSDKRSTYRAIGEFSRYGRMKIVLFAHGWPYDDAKWLEKLAQKPMLRMTTPKYVSHIIHGNNLWVVAAGNDTMNVTKQFPQSPMNIGDMKNILVVAACRDCQSRKAKLEDYSNFSEHGFVHVAAFGGTRLSGEVPATATEAAYALAAGTSQAAALVAGLASAMTCQYPDQYVIARDMKVRIQSAVFPPLDEHLAKGIASGVIDAKKALMDPTVHFVAAHNKRPRRAKRLQWCTHTFRPVDPDLGSLARGGEVRADHIRHMVSFKTEDSEKAWYFFYEDTEPEKGEIGIVNRTGPGLFEDNLPIVRVTYEDNEVEVLKAEDIDFILTPPRFGVDTAAVGVSASACR